MKEYSLSNVHNDFDGYNKLVNFYSEYKDEFLEDIKLNINIWFDANLCSVLGSIVDKFSESLNSVNFMPSDNIQIILQKNSFLSQFGYSSLSDTYHTTIKYLKLKTTDGRFFSDYVENQLLIREEFPTMSDAVHEKISQSIYEMFVNAQIHSETSHIYTCGQYFPARNTLDFTIVDTGIGFAGRIKKNFDLEISSKEAIIWSLKDGNTTKKDVSGGIGLALLKEFISQNNGKIQIITGNSLYQMSNRIEDFLTLDNFFDGTIINMSFKTDDSTSYTFVDELDDEDIF
ncbi:ATP-binding protein [Aliarcobacter skirrowii]|uniref:ATP-binding protein n=1 Tax=Aliarcobacter skirrowii TaxID=28200 RepID=UPI002A368687|nr:ATP-binding protein [Aliarcobacter skirrowii]MDY0181335.1 ATP-binding protein [Aliarcobacter skirrowii]